MKRKARSLRKLPTMRSNRQVARFVADADLSKYDLSAMRPLQFEFAPKEARVTMRLPGELLEAVKAAAERQGVPYQRFIRQALERALRGM